MPTIIPTSTILNLQILPSVLLTVLKFRFSLVRKYFCIRPTVLNCPLTRLTISSSADVCSGVVPGFCGSEAERDSFSMAISRSTSFSVKVEDGLERQKRYSPLFWAVKT
jgi:hypothetical protein